jgi:acyl transferase domain-containing protein
MTAELPAPIVWMFSGQGAQYYSMGQVLYQRNRTFRQWMDRLDEVAADYVGQSIVAVMYDDKKSKSQPFDHLLHSHPALFMVQYAMARTLEADGFPPPDYLLGASLGEFVAAAVAETVPAEAMLFDLIKQARLFEAHCSGGAMLVVLDHVATFHTSATFSRGCELAGENFERCFVISGRQGEIDRIAAELKRADITHQMLPVPIAFHSSWIDPVAAAFQQTFSARVAGLARLPMISSARRMAGEEPGNASVASSSHWWQVIRQPIDFRQALAAFAHRHPQAIYLDLGPSGGMAAFARYNLPEEVHDRIHPVLTPFGRDEESMATAKQRISAIRGQWGMMSS